MEINSLQAILFDLDGVLVDTCDLHYRALNKALKEVIGYEISEKDHKETFNGLPTSVKLKKLGLFESEIKAISELKQYYTKKEILETDNWFNDKSDLYNYLLEHNIKMACVTNCSKTSAHMLLGYSNQLQYMSLVITNEDVTQNKPSPDCYNLAIDKLGVDPERCLCVEDSDKGVEAVLLSKAKYLWHVKETQAVTLTNFVRYLHSK